MTEKNDGGPAFPSEGEGFGNPKYHAPGMSLRDYFAGQALSGMLTQAEAKSIEFLPGLYKTCAKAAYDIADALLAQREKEQ